VAPRHPRREFAGEIVIGGKSKAPLTVHWSALVLAKFNFACALVMVNWQATATGETGVGGDDAIIDCHVRGVGSAIGIYVLRRAAGGSSADVSIAKSQV